MPDTLNKQSLVNLLIDSPLREPIKINLIDIVNNTSDPDLPKVFPTIIKELEIFQKATERRMKLAEETIAKLSGGETSPQEASIPSPTPETVMPAAAEPTDVASMTPAPDLGGLSAPKLDLPPLPTMPAPETTAAPTPMMATPLAAPAPLGGAPSPQGDEAALAEIQKELDSLKTTTAQEVSAAATPAV